MMNIHEHLLTCLAEESGEIAQAAHKALRFGIDDGYPGTERTNRRDIVQEVNDLIGVLELLCENGIRLDGLLDREAIEAKKTKVKKYMEYAVERGCLDLTGARLPAVD
jgi:NTP pyrophosphatase (non-canonical NTP hydrolase)